MTGVFEQELDRQMRRRLDRGLLWLTMVGLSERLGWMPPDPNPMPVVRLFRWLP